VTGVTTRATRFCGGGDGGDTQTCSLTHGEGGGRVRPQRQICMHADAGRSSNANSGLPAAQQRRYLPFPEARATVRALGLLNQQVRLCVPGATAAQSDPNMVRVRVPPAAALLFSLDLYARGRLAGAWASQGWNNWRVSGGRPNNIPARPDHVYWDEGWQGWDDWLGADTR
jgi:hypothetical protein